MNTTRGHMPARTDSNPTLDEEHEISTFDETQEVAAPPIRREVARQRQQTPVETHAASDAPDGRAPESSRRQRVRWVLFLLLPLALIGGGYWYVVGGRVMSTDDAYVNAEKVGISTDVSGMVADVNVRDNEEVAAGQVLFRLNPLQFQIALTNAQANLAQIALTLEAMKRDYQRMLTDAAAQQTQVALDRTQYERAARLLESGVESQAAYDRARYTLQTDESKLEALRQQAHVQLARLGGNPDAPTMELPQYKQALAQVVEAQRQLDHTLVKAPFAGIVTEVPAIAPGKYLAASTTAFYLVDTHHVWIEAAPKETQLTYVRAGQPATVLVDTYPGLRWHGTVESVSPAAAQEFSLLPAQNTSGNWVKVVQRINMRIRVDTSDKHMPALRAGMSVEIHVDTGHPRGLPHFLTALF
jgi:membrane fusion protein, multidrug efflux system